ncbi:MAG: F0F1 ATP synthase subunit gamma [Pseudomonadota bacterium]
MTRRRDIERRRHSLAEIRSIMNSMRTLAYLETRKLDRFLAAQHAVVESIEVAAADLLACCPEILPAARSTTPVCVVIGSERGFCGDFNHALQRSMESTVQAAAPGCPLLVITGHRLSALLEDDPRVAQRLDGAGVLEEVAPLLGELVRVLTALQAQHGPLTVLCLYHNSTGGIAMQKLLPPFQQLHIEPAAYPQPPDLNLAPQALLGELAEHYLFAALHEILYTSLLVENRQRASHLQGAVQRLDDQAETLARQANILRQEEIIEEIEVILLGAMDAGDQPQP